MVEIGKNTADEDALITTSEDALITVGETLQLLRPDPRTQTAAE